MRLLVHLADAPAVRVGFVVLAVSLLAGGVWWANQTGADACGWLAAAESTALEHIWLGYAILFCVSLGIFLTLMPLGSATVMTAGFLLGPMAGLVQFAALMLASTILYEIAREQDHEALAHRLKDFPRLHRIGRFAQTRGMAFAIISRLLPVVPSAAASLAGAYFCISRRDYYLGTLISGWVRPVALGMIGAAAGALPVC